MKEKPAFDAVDFSALFQLIMDRGDDAILLLDKQGHVRYANRPASQVLGYKAHELQSLQIFDLEEDLNLASYLQRWESANGTKETHWRVKWKLRSGEQQYFRVHALLFKSSTPPLFCCFIPPAGSIQNLKEPTYRYLKRFEVAIWEWNIINGDFQTTDNFPDILQLKKDGLPPARQLNIVSALKERLSAKQFSELIQKVKAAQKNRAAFELQLQLIDDRKEPAQEVRLFGYPVEKDNIAGKLQGSLTVISSSPKEKSMASAVLERSEAMVCWINPDCTLRYVNQAMGKRLGYEKSEMTGGQLEITDIDAENTATQWQEIWDQASAGGTMKIESTLKTKSERVFPAEFHLDFLDIGGVKLISLSAHDITDRRQKEAELRKALLEVQTLSGQLEEENIYLKEEISEGNKFENILTQSPNYQKVLQQVEQVAPTEATVLIEGETGTGKELLARAVHSLSKRSERSLVRVNCAALSEELILSELFGHEKGAFTGASSAKTGRFELADKGTIFLDEIGEVSLRIQSQLLRILQEGEFERVGGVETLSVDVRIIAATNRDLRKMVTEKKFREDLYYRLSVFPLYNPPLRERREDIPLLVRHFMKQFARKNGKHIDNIRAKDLKRLKQYDFPGNIRELMNIVEQAVVLSSNNTLDLSYWSPVATAQQAIPYSAEEGFPTLEEVQRQHILHALEKTNWRVTGPQGAAKLLGMKGQTLFSKMKKLGIQRD
ncbi:MAG: sigma 54-interacting transcriptional regulator [Phaeodactylibacter sp.]|uniref:sigma 54-interacting transcriptional regulator n=1 Tax=Phaeodactylibacter sp. TaxID=1940289 RepID=UPI0032ED1E2A